MDVNIAVISGASSGIGAEFAKELDKYGLDELWLIGRSKERLDNLTKELSSAVRLFQIDLSKIEAFDEIKLALNEVKPRISYLICSAGVGYNGKFEDITEEQIALTISVNCTALSLLNRLCLPYFDKDTRVINIASGSGFSPQPSFAVYAASKSFVISLSRALGHEQRKNSVYYTAVCPGPVDTEFFSNLENVKEYKKKFLISPKKVAIGALKAAKNKRKVYTPTFSMKLVHLASKILPTSFILSFYK